MSPDAVPSVYHERVDEPHRHRAEDEHPRPGAREATRRASGSAPHANMSAVEIQKVIADGE